MSDVVEGLRAYQQGDADGVMVLVSRQACDEGAAEIETLRTQLAHWKTFAIHAESEHAAWKNTAREVDEELRALRGTAPFTDTARSALLWVLWHHQGGSSPVGQPLRFALGMDAHQRLTDAQVQEAKQWAALTGATTAEFHGSRVDGWGRPLSTEPQNAVAAAYGGLVQTPQG